MNLLVHARIRSVFGRGNERMTGGDLPCCLQRPFLQLEFSLACTPVSWAVVDTNANLSCLGDHRMCCFSPAQSEEGAVWMKHDEVAPQVAHEIELHLCEL